MSLAPCNRPLITGSHVGGFVETSGPRQIDDRPSGSVPRFAICAHHEQRAERFDLAKEYAELQRSVATRILHLRFSSPFYEVFGLGPPIIDNRDMKRRISIRTCQINISTAYYQQVYQVEVGVLNRNV